MTIEIDTDQIIDELTDSATFQQWVDERIDERAPDEYELPDDVTRDSQLSDLIAHHDLPEAMRDAFREHDLDWFGLDHSTIDHDGIGDSIRAHLDSLPSDADARCALGRAFETAVVKVFLNVLRGEEVSQFSTHELDEAIQRAASRIGAPVTPPEQPYVSPSHTDEDVERAEAEADRESEPAVLGDVIERTRSEVMVMTMNGQRDGLGSAHVYRINAGGADDHYLVTRDEWSYRYRNEHAAFSKAFRLVAWNCHAAPGFRDPDAIA